ncbi:DUF3159 domain-containing protein [Microbacterium ulmi]|uniref:DUF3159 domain-containing protein n=1 Tax=Microbacterium ulmi TaxID=179095 RepID=A0A7Y2M0F9_9MICO|nr:DUF3159 domain-containing protein [Microbacterium ulmi]NNH04215.1 DUF3159 domain-containing protein [Microbacterium ulmi]
MTPPPPHHREPGDDAGEEPTASELLGAALGAAARRAGLDPDSDAPTGRVIWQVIGGWRGILESVLPLLAFVVIYTATHELLWALGISVGVAALFTVVRVATKSPPVAALSGLVAAVIAAGLPLFTGNAADQFVVGFVTNIAYGAAFLISAVVRWPLIGVISGFLMEDGLQWRQDAHKRRVFFWLSIAWAALFLARLAVQLPFYWSGDIAALGTLKIVMGIPFFAALLAGTWLVVRRLYPRSRTDAEPPAE